MNWPLMVVLAGGGVPLVAELLWKLLRREFGSDLLAGLSIVTSVFLEEYLAGSLVVLMLSGGEALESFAVQSASSVLDAAARGESPTQEHIERRVSRFRICPSIRCRLAILWSFFRTGCVPLDVDGAEWVAARWTNRF